MTRKTTMKTKAQDKIKAKCSECEENAVALFHTIPFCTYHANLNKYMPNENSISTTQNK